MIKSIFHKTFCLFVIFVCGCSPSSSDDFQKEGEAQARKLTQELRNIHSREELAKAVPHIKKKFNELVDLIIEARQFQETHNDNDLSATDQLASEDLCEELKRIYRLEGGREAIEKVQREPLIRLDAFEKKLVKQRELRK